VPAALAGSHWNRAISENTVCGGKSKGGDHGQASKASERKMAIDTPNLEAYKLC
jgi:hypothetical protein